MEETTQGLDEANQKADGGTGDGMTKTVFEQQKVDGIAYETHQRALKQRAQFREKNESLEAQLQSYRQKELEDEGKHKEVIQAQRKQITELEDKQKKMSSNYMWNVIGAQLKSEFSAKGVGNPDKVLKFAVATCRDDLSSIEVDDQYQVNREDLSRFVDKFLGENTDMKFVNKVGVKDLSPGRVELNGNENKPLAKKSLDELMSDWQEAGN